MYYYVKVKSPGSKLFSFLNSKNGKTRLKIHAVMIDGEARANELAHDIAKLNKGVLTKIEKVI